MSISVIGGDLRIIRLIEMYIKDGVQIFSFGHEKYFNNKTIDKNLKICNNLEEVISNSNIIISGMPLSKDKETVNAAFSDNIIRLEELKNILMEEQKSVLTKKDQNKLEKIQTELGKTTENFVKNGKIVKRFIAGGIPEDFYDTGIMNIDLLEYEKLTILNAIPTVEGTIKIVIEEREETIFDSNVLICGYGRIGKMLCDKFKDLGANVYCVARKEADLAWIREERYIPLTYKEIEKYGNKFDIIINTVPSLVIDRKELDCLKNNVLIVDVASNPGGINKEEAQAKGIKVITALGIPGKETPKTAAKFIKEIIDELK